MYTPASVRAQHQETPRVEGDPLIYLRVGAAVSPWAGPLEGDHSRGLRFKVK